MDDNLMSEDAPEDLHWIDRLAQTLDDLAQSITAVRINLPTLSNSEYRSLARQANEDACANLFFEEYLPKLDSYPAAAIAVLQEHPVLRARVDGICWQTRGYDAHAAWGSSHAQSWIGSPCI